MREAEQGRIKRRRAPVAAIISACFLLFIAVAAALAGIISPHDPLEIDPTRILENPSATFWLGTDELGRDLLSRLIYGARISLSVALAAVAIAGLIGVPLGIGLAYVGGRIESLAMRVVDVFVSLPEIFIAIVVLAFVGGGILPLIGTIGILYVPQFARVAHGMARSILARDHVLAAVSLGAGPLWIVRNEVVVNMYSVIAVQASFTLSFAMLTEAGLSFLGLGVPAPTPSWGQMVGTLKDYIFNNAWPVVLPSLALFATVLSVNLLGDWLQDRLNPELDR